MVPTLQKRLGDLPPSQSTDPDTERYLLSRRCRGAPGVGRHGCNTYFLVLDDLHWADKPTAPTAPSCRGQHLGCSCPHPRHLPRQETRLRASAHRGPRHAASGTGRLRRSIKTRSWKTPGSFPSWRRPAGHELSAGWDWRISSTGRPTVIRSWCPRCCATWPNREPSCKKAGVAAGQQKARRASSHYPTASGRSSGPGLARLGDEATKVLSTASVIGRDFDLDLLVVTSRRRRGRGHRPPRAGPSTRPLSLELSGVSGRYRSLTPSVQHTLYEDLGGTRRTRLHKAVGEAIERLYGENSQDLVGELARHFLHATRPTDSDKAISYARRAGEAALAALGSLTMPCATSPRLWSWPLSRQSFDPLTRIDLLIGLGTAQRQAGIA